MSAIDRAIGAPGTVAPATTATQADPAEARSRARTAFVGEYRNLLKRVRGHSDEPTNHLDLARFYVKHSYLQKAHSSLQVAKALQPRRIETHYLLAWIYQKEAKWEQARATYRQILRIKPSEPLARFHLGETLLALGQKAEAYDHLMKSVEMEPTLAAAYWHLGRLACERGDHGRALSHFQTLKNIEPNNPDVYFELGNVLRAQAQTDRSVMAFQKALEVKPGHVKSLTALAAVYLDGNLADRSIQILEELLQKEAMVPEAYLTLARAYHAVGRIPQALAALLQFQKAHPTDPRGHGELARLYYLSGEYELSEEEFLKAIETSLDDRDLYISLGTLYLNRKPTGAAIEQFRLLCSRFPNDPQIFNILGQLYERFGRREEAIEAYGQAIQGAPQAESLYCRRAQVQIALGRYNEALRDFERAREINPDCAEAKLDTELIRGHKKMQEAHELYSQGLRCMHDGEHKQALQLLQQAVRQAPGNARWLDDYLDLAMYCGQFNDALEALERLVALEPDDGRLLLRYAHLDYHLLQYERARELFERCISLMPNAVEPRIGLIRAMRHKLLDRSLSAGKFEALVTAYEGNLASASDRNMALLELAYLHIALGHLIQPGREWVDRAIGYLEAMSGQEHEEVYRYKLLVSHELYRILEDDEGAIGMLERLHRSFPHNATYAQALVEHLMHANDHGRAYRVGQDVLEKFPENGLLRARCLQLFSLLAGSQSDARQRCRNKIRALQQQAASSPGDWTAFFDLGMALVYMSRPGEWAEARTKTTIALNKARALAPQSQWPVWGQVKAMVRDLPAGGRLPAAARDKALSLLRSAVRQFPSEPSFHLYLGRILHRSDEGGHYDEGTREFTAAVILGGGFAPASFDLAIQSQASRHEVRASHHYISVLESILGSRHLGEIGRRLRSLVP